MTQVSATPRPLTRPKSLTEQAADTIRTMILNGEMQLGEALSEMALATRLGVSKTPVREALVQLKLEGLVVIQPQRGTFVFRMTAEQVQKLCEMREVLELSALELALRHDPAHLMAALHALQLQMADAIAADDAARYRALDLDFHHAIVDAAQNDYLSEAHAGIAFRVQALRNRLSQDSQLNRVSISEHAMVLSAIREGDCERASAMLRQHVRGTEERYLARL